MKVMFRPGPGRDGSVCSDGKDAEGSFGPRSNAWPRLDHRFLPIRYFAPRVPRDRKS
jgi:hypothetical protein